MANKETVRCTRCDKMLNNKRIVWLEFNGMHGTYHDPKKEAVPPSESQGGFPFGVACAKAQLAEK